MMLPLVPPLRAQASAAPLPSQIFTAKKVFISNAGGELSDYVWNGGPDRPYNELYAAIKSWGRYEFVAAPGDADIVLEISFSYILGGPNPHDAPETIPQLKLVLLDAKTRIALWTISETVKPFSRHKTGDRNFEDAIDKLVSDLKALTAQPAAAAK
jgi:hypothetical protein